MKRFDSIVLCLALALTLSWVSSAQSAATIEKLVWTENPAGLMFGTYPREGGATAAKVLEDLGMLPIQRVCWDRWSWIETSPGVYNWTAASFSILEETHKFGADAVGSIYMANMIPDFYAQDITDPVTRQAAWDFIYAFTQEMHARLGKTFVVIDYEMQWYVFHLESIDPDDWAEWYVYLVGAARAADPDCFVVCDVIADDHDYYLPGDWLTTAMAVSDALGIDDYGMTPEIIHDDIQWFIDNYADGKPVHILENGFATWEGFSNKAHGTEEEQAEFFEKVIDDVALSYAGVVKSYVQFMASDRGTGPGIEDHWGMVTYNYEREKPSMDTFRQAIANHPAVTLASVEDVTEDLSEGQPVDLLFSEGREYEGLRFRQIVNLSAVTGVSLNVDFVDEDGTGGYLVNVNGNWKYCTSSVANIMSYVQHGLNEIEVYFPQKWFPGSVTVSGVSLELMTVNSRSHDNFESYAGEPEFLAEWTAEELLTHGLETGGGENVYEGLQSMHLDYDLTPGVPYYGVVSHNLDSPEDWTGFERLAIGYKGDAGNSIEKLRLKLLDSQGVAFLSMQKLSATGSAEWQTWDIPLAGAPWDQLSDVLTVQVQVVAQQSGSGTMYLDDFSLIVPPDEFPPTLSIAEVIGPLKVDVTFGEKVDQATAEDTGNYLIDGGAIPVRNATLYEDSMTVKLRIDGYFAFGSCYSLEVSGIEDLNGNVVTPGIGDSLRFCWGDDEHDLLDVEEGMDTAFRTGIVSTYPNPFNPSVQVHYDLARDAGRVTLDVFNVRGRRVRTLVDESRPPGRYVAVWDGRDHHGRKVGAGVYFCRFRAGSVEDVRRLVLVK